MSKWWPWSRARRASGVEKVCIVSGPEDIASRYSIQTGQVCPQPLTEDEVRDLLAEGLLRPTHEQGPKRIALTIGSDEKTVRRARDKTTTLRLDLTVNTLLACENTLDPLFAHFNKQLIDIEPRPLDWHEIAATAASIAEIYRRAMEKHGRPTHQDEPKLKELTRKLLALGQGACR